ncbi:hypothetical protein HPC49_04340 [Pyxidicoccus fallax]|uniref:Uncharacterized protein n=1 Tax=Pyxidicoccus fallax TaxID=394095 RepID=A0A848LE94_9BACT|nr:hypothetical protein [Pyxidicoccus fallax]NMO15135.1 hypothetical protein [Pyxidicoccus fallax]NPC77481.1 hypothetical protein [Pyxidicoccus fallax]
MSWRQELSHYEPDTLLVIEIAERFLQDYFQHDAARAESILTEYFRRFGQWFDEQFVHHQLSWGIATEAHFCIHLGGSRGDFPEWRMKEGFLSTPPEALEYLRKHYWNRTR